MNEKVGTREKNIGSWQVRLKHLLHKIYKIARA